MIERKRLTADEMCWLKRRLSHALEIGLTPDEIYMSHNKLIEQTISLIQMLEDEQDAWTDHLVDCHVRDG